MAVIFVMLFNLFQVISPSLLFIHWLPIRVLHSWQDILLADECITTR